ncbi:MAG: hypothetical protein Q8O34_05025 [Rhodocyclaceae bacterium]|nr:hypothetical protein [Rhodocyclaceae bacterium]
MNEENSQEDLYYGQFMQEIKRVSKETGIKIPESYYRYGICRCYKCEKEILAFAWPHKIPREKPIPETIGRRATSMSGCKYWNNSCHYCHAVQGEFFLFHEPDGPFFAFEYSDDFVTDIKRIANYHYTYR